MGILKARINLTIRMIILILFIPLFLLWIFIKLLAKAGDKLDNLERFYISPNFDIFSEFINKTFPLNIKVKLEEEE